MKSIVLTVLGGCALLLAACGSIDHSTAIDRQIGKQYVAGKGDVILKINHEKNLPNAFGGADIFGRKSSTGATYIAFLGASSNKIHFKKGGHLSASNETTMSRTGMIVPSSQTTTMSGMVGNTPVVASATQHQDMYIPPAKSNTTVTKIGETDIFLNLKKEKIIATSGYLIEVISATENNLTYRVLKND